jgi:dTDP-4-amino-4,6-dideoxygalactose transaminase
LVQALLFRGLFQQNALLLEFRLSQLNFMSDKIWLSSPHMGGTEEKYVAEAFATNWIAPLGPHVNGFEEDLCRYTGAAHAAALSSGTSALHLGLILLGVGQDDYVLCQSMTFSASANPIRYQGAVPVFVDSEEDTWNMCPVQLERAIEACISGGEDASGTKLTARMPKAIIPVHLYGMPAKMKEIMAVAERYGIPVLEDAAEALGSKYEGKACGTFGHLAALSFNGNKIITTSGGGALLGNDGDTIAKARFLATQARDAAPHYQHSHVGYNYRLSNVLAGIGRGRWRCSISGWLSAEPTLSVIGFTLRDWQEKALMSLFTQHLKACSATDGCLACSSTQRETRALPGKKCD